LRRYARGMVRRLGEFWKRNAHLLDLSRFLAGALYSLQRAETLNYQDPREIEGDRSDHAAELTTLLAVMGGTKEGGDLPPAWEAGFYYNASIMRLDACHERSPGLRDRRARVPALPWPPALRRRD
jgi:hypothetical protein